MYSTSNDDSDQEMDFHHVFTSPRKRKHNKRSRFGATPIKIEPGTSNTSNQLDTTPTPQFRNYAQQNHYIRIPELVYKAAMTGQLTLKQAFHSFDIGQLSRKRVPTPVFILAIQGNLTLDKAYEEFNTFTGDVSFPYTIEVYRIAAQKNINPPEAKVILDNVRNVVIPIHHNKDRKRGRPRGSSTRGRTITYGNAASYSRLPVRRQLSRQLSPRDIELAVAALAKYPYQISIAEANKLYENDSEFRQTVERFATEGKKAPSRTKPSPNEYQALMEMAAEENKNFIQLQNKWKTDKNLRKRTQTRVRNANKIKRTHLQHKHIKHEKAIVKLEKLAQQRGYEGPTLIETSHAQG